MEALLQQYLEAIRGYADRKIGNRNDQCNFVGLESQIAQKALADLKGCNDLQRGARERDDEELAGAVDQLISTHLSTSQAASETTMIETLAQLQSEAEEAAEAAVTEEILRETQAAIRERITDEAQLSKLIEADKVIWENANRSIQWWSARLKELLLETQ